jgi:hypothetical protein
VEWNWVQYYWGHYWPIVPALDDDGWWWVWSNWWNAWQGKLKYWEKTCISATLSTTNIKLPDLGSNSGHCSGKPVSNHLSYGNKNKWSLTRMDHVGFKVLTTVVKKMYNFWIQHSINCWMSTDIASNFILIFSGLNSFTSQEIEFFRKNAYNKNWPWS